MTYRLVVADLDGTARSSLQGIPLGGGRDNAAILLECAARGESMTGRRPQLTFSAGNRIGGHICYYGDACKRQRHDPSWRMRSDLDAIIAEMVAGGAHRG